MQKFYILAISILLSFSGLAFAGENINTDALLDRVSASVETPKKEVIDNFNYSAYLPVNALDLVARPAFYLNKNVKITGKFDKFSTLGLDYKPAYKSSDEYISFLIKRDDTTFDIPLSELKLFLKKEKAEKLLDLKTNDEIQISGTVFSDALGDAWIDVSDLTLIKKAPEKKNGV